ncbi:DUF3073 domain-containing protein [Corynebacterium sp. sy017]|uniref:DUF3073 domain-containing protein n=1 Tax=unclassified Corynebacterium TaxID=2624378 RepID=UPI001186BF15|nr:MULTISPECIES: DUF3073 domain-containing protein [unclassified Corynebacterium]MBP3089215.1 DUF3073 domain-containing protein [Corynebacterium sp. sy017]QDZ43155.1 DUF3073 domain-containing protein [Corynebacterium sp. sy039]TSD91078.1 DUF3073 domain-containing protein [Corynebacterium sp. SY003]
MGRGRAKAKQTKVARQLKYNTPSMDLDSLQRELAEQSHRNSSDRTNDKDYDGYGDYSDDYSDYEDQYAKYADWIEEDSEDDSADPYSKN